MVKDPLSQEERQQLLALARKSIEVAVRSENFYSPELPSLPARLQEPGATFVTLTVKRSGELRGCIGSLAATEPLAIDVCRHAAAAAMEDPRFYPVRAEEIPQLEIEISRLTAPVPLDYHSPEELPSLLTPMEDGVVLRDGYRRATFLPQVWEKLPEPELFLAHLCEKMGASPDIWRRKKLEVEIYHVEEFREE